MQKFHLGNHPKSNPMNSIFLDCEWYPRGRIFLIGYRVNAKTSKALWGKQIDNFPTLLKKNKDHFLIVFGPDIAYLENHFGIAIREKYICINILRMARDLEPDRDSWKLSAIEKDMGIKREVDKYKVNIFKIWSDWKVLDIRSQIISYNLQDVNSLAIITEHYIKTYKLKEKDILKYRLI